MPTARFSTCPPKNASVFWMPPARARPVSYEKVSTTSIVKHAAYQTRQFLPVLLKVTRKTLWTMCWAVTTGAWLIACTTASNKGWIYLPYL